MNYETMSGAELGRQFAPDDIKDREGWGRRIKRAAAAASMTVGQYLIALTRVSGRPQSDVHMDAMGDVHPDRHLRYKAPHAYRGTPERPHFSRYTRKPRAFHA